MNNPFELTFGLKPSNYISRLKQSEEIISNFKSSTGNKLFIITVVRGTGKTVMLSHISKYFESEKNWIVIELIPECYFTNWSIIRKNKKSGKEVLIAVDEVSNNDYVKTFTQAFQLLIRKEYPIHLLMTGLYQNIYELQNDKDLTFLYRAPKISLEPLNIAAITNSYRELLNITKDEALLLAKETKGYAYAYQVLGYLVFERNDSKLDDNLYAKYDQYLEEYVYEKMYSELSSNDKRILKAFTSDGTNNVGDLLEKSNMKKNVFSVYRDRLIKRGIIETPEYGKLSLKLPRFYEFLERQI